MNQHGLAFDVAPGEIRSRAGADPHDVEVQSAGRRRRRVERRVHRVERVRLASGRERVVPVGGKPLRRHRKRLPVDVLQIVFLEFRFGPVVHHRLVLRSGDAAPVLVAVVAALDGDRDDLLQGLFHLEAVDLQVLLIGGWHERPRVGVVSHVPVRVQQPPILGRRYTGPREGQEQTKDENHAGRAESWSNAHDCLLRRFRFSNRQRERQAAAPTPPIKPVWTKSCHGNREERVDALLTVKQLPGVSIRSADDALAAVETDDTALAGDLTYKQGPDRITLEQRVEQVPHPDLSHTTSRWTRARCQTSGSSPRRRRTRSRTERA